ncbi:hypothetical protein [Pseudomonas frederiksbergensis]|uniref:hypothetical protein n=1 Tax=Pseudomonas frederiksbergensis TaxID=104087 RepID=UPI003D224E70
MSALMKKLKKPTEIKLSLQAFNAFFRLFSGVLRIETPARKNHLLELRSCRTTVCSNRPERLPLAATRRRGAQGICDEGQDAP